MSYDVHVVRTVTWPDAANDPILKPEVDALVAADPDLAWSSTDYVDMADKAGIVTRYYMIAWRGSTCFWWYRDQVLCSGADNAQLIKLVHVARALRARVIGDDGETYDVKKGLLGKEKLMVTPPDA